MLLFRADTTVFSRKTLIFLSWTAAGCSTGISLEKAFVFGDCPDHDCVRTGRFDGEKAVLSALHTCAAWYRCIVLCCGFAGDCGQAARTGRLQPMAVQPFCRTQRGLRDTDPKECLCVVTGDIKTRDDAVPSARRSPNFQNRRDEHGVSH